MLTTTAIRMKKKTKATNLYYQPVLNTKVWVFWRIIGSTSYMLLVWNYFFPHFFNRLLIMSGSHHKEPVTTPYSCHGFFIDRSIFRLNLSRIQIPTGTSVTNCNHKHGLPHWRRRCRHVHVRPYCFILTEACSCRLELTVFAGKISNNRLVCKNAARTSC